MMVEPEKLLNPREQRALDIYDLFMTFSANVNAFRYGPDTSIYNNTMSTKSTLELLSIIADDYIKDKLKDKAEIGKLQERTSEFLKWNNNKNDIEKYKELAYEINICYSKLINIALINVR